MERIGGAEKLPISLSYTNDFAGASGAAKEIIDLLGDPAAGKKSKAGVGKIVGFVILLAIVGVVVFVLAYKMLERVYG